MKFWWSSSKNNTNLVEEEKKKKKKKKKKKESSSGSSRMKSFFQFFAKKTFLSPQMKFLPPIPSPHVPVLPKPIQTPVLSKPMQIPVMVEDKKDEICSTSTTPPQIVKGSPSIVAKLMGLESPASPQRTSKPVLDSPQNKPSRVPLPKTANNTLQTLQDKRYQELPSKLKDASNLVQPEPAKAATSGLIQNDTPLSSKYSHQNQQKLEQSIVDPCPTRPVKSPPRSPSLGSNAKILEATAKLLEIGSQPLRLAAVNSSRSELRDPVIERFGSKANHALTDLGGLKNNGTSNKVNINEQVNVGEEDISTKRDVSPKNTANTPATKKDTQQDPNKRNAQENISAKLSPRSNKIKQNRVPLNNAPKDFIALNRSMIKATPLRKKNKGLERKQTNKISVKKVRPNDINNRNDRTKFEKIKGGNVKIGAKETLISKGVGLVSEKPPDLKNHAQEEKEMCIVSFTFSSPMKHSNRYTSSSDLEGRSDSGLTESSVSSSILLDDGRDSFSYRDARICPTTIHQGPSLYDEFISGTSNELSVVGSTLDADKKQIPLTETKDGDPLIETKFARTNTDAKKIEKRSNVITAGVCSTRNRRSKKSNISPKIELLLQTVVFSNQNSGAQVSSFLNETTEAVLKAMPKIPYNCKEVDDQLQEVIADFVIEHLYLVQSRVLNCGYNSWRGLKTFYTKERIVREIKEEIADLQKLVGKELEFFIVKDMENWMHSCVNFEIGIQMEKEIISQLIGEVVRDFLT